MMISYAQNFEDVILWRVLKHVSHGRYVDVGAFHPEVDSVTKWFYDEGWSGINVEPVPEMFAILAAARPRDTNICAAAGAAPGTAEMAVIPQSMGLSSFDIAFVEAHIDMPHKLVQVEVRPLRELLQPFVGQDIHFLKIDAEGSEEGVLRGMDFVRFRPWIVVVEATKPLSQVRTLDRWHDILSGNNYLHAYFDGLNDFFVAAEHIELAQRLGPPPNVFDEFEMAATLHEKQARAVAERSCQELTAKGESLRAEGESLRAEVSRRDQELAEASRHLAASQAELAATQEDRAVWQGKFAAAEKQITALMQQVASLQADLAAAREEQALWQAKSAAAEKQISELSELLTASDAAIARLTDDLSELAQARRRDRETYAECQRQLHQVLNSRSFRWLAPARRLKAMLFPPQN